jgi:hypothetical protein
MDDDIWLVRPTVLLGAVHRDKIHDKVEQGMSRKGPARIGRCEGILIAWSLRTRLRSGNVPRDLVRSQLPSLNQTGRVLKPWNNGRFRVLPRFAAGPPETNS